MSNQRILNKEVLRITYKSEQCKSEFPNYIPPNTEYYCFIYKEEIFNGELKMILFKLIPNVCNFLQGIYIR